MKFLDVLENKKILALRCWDKHKKKRLTQERLLYVVNYTYMLENIHEITQLVTFNRKRIINRVTVLSA